ncbi:uncharacterized protein F5147DRAFT_773143 [Suillus discolor]|uniref:DUF6532 domain-containing protein n=1 Tax=Suillus discolor TaxID=1912936 RepID=A0A9P7F750_9AGAM|nr:uncharacterized protein F5147DRAFT_773143 [Suillus discolor]KAG2109332.1 hypothetical protein F5147DRAFT_773143 [Suillus discolor]
MSETIESVNPHSSNSYAHPSHCPPSTVGHECVNLCSSNGHADPSCQPPFAVGESVDPHSSSSHADPSCCPPFTVRSNCTASALLINHHYHYFMKFNDDNVPKPVQNRPYLGDMMVHLMKGHYFNGLKSVSVMFGKRFSDIAKNKAKRPEVTIPMVALTATSVYAAFFWKAHGTPAKFNFTGNQFSKVYFFHVKFLKDLSAKSPEKFHKLMADIFTAIQDLMQYNNSTTDAEADAIAFLGLDGMDED